MQNYANFIRAALVSILSFQMVSCGTLMYPERRGNKAGHLDVGVVILDTILLFFGIIPGVIAFAVDFSSGCIYLPASAKGPGQDKYRVVKFDPKNYTTQELEEIISKETGRDFHFNDQRIQYREIKNTDELSMHFEKFEQEASALSAAVSK